MTANMNSEIVLVLDEEFLRAPAMLAAAMFPDRSGWYIDLEMKRQREEEYGEAYPFEMWSQDARCAACDGLFMANLPVPPQTPDDVLPDILARYGDGVWQKLANEHRRECADDLSA